MDRYIGRLLDNRYEILEIIGVGGMAVVYKARDHRLKRLVAVKILKDEYSQDEEFRRRFNAESQAVAMLGHPNIVAVYDVSEAGGVNYIVMELIDGISLKQYMERRGILNWRETLHFSLQIIKALEHAHSRGIIHRDIKPHNIMILKDGSVKVADFGIARMTASQNTLTREALGSVHYISPEQAKGGRTDCRSDIYSLGVVMYEMMTGRTPYDGETPVSVAIQHINGRAKAPHELNPEIPKGLEQIAMHAMTAALSTRYATATEMLNDLEEFRKNPSIVFQFAVPAGTRSGKSPQKGTTGKQDSAEKKHSGKRERSRATGTVEEVELRNRKNIRMASIAILCTLAIILIGYLLVGVMLPLLLGTGRMPEVPSLVGKNASELDPKEYGNFILESEEIIFDDTVPYGCIIRQHPMAGTKAEKGSTIYLVISKGQRTDKMPALSGMTVNDAEDMLDGLELGLTVVLDYINSTDFPKGTIINTDPVSKITLEKGQRVTLYISLGTETEEMIMTTVPLLVDNSLAHAIELLERAGLRVGTLTEVENDAEKGTVVAQAILAGQSVTVDTRINLTISKGPGSNSANDDPVVPTISPAPDTNPASSEKTGEVELKSIEKKIKLPNPETFGAEQVTLTVCLNGEEVIRSEKVELAKGSVTATLTGSGTMTMDVLINGVVYYTEQVVFN